jgi:hypothetical protein
MQALRRGGRAEPEGLRLVIGTGGNAAAFWSAHAGAVRAEVLSLESFRHEPRAAGAGLDWAGFASLENAGVYRRNSRRLRAFLRENPVDLALIDSDYHCLPLVAARTPVVALGQAWDVIRRRSLAGPRAGISRRSMLVERLDYLFQRAVAGRVLSPSFEPAESGARGVEAVPLIVREEFTAAPPSRAEPSGPLQVLLSGSGIGASRFVAYAETHRLPLLRAVSPASWSLDPQGRPLIDRAAAVLIQGGLSSISECVARRRKMIVLPLAGHAEQRANALEVERRGLGIAVDDLSAAPAELLARLETSTPPSAKAAWPRVDGAAAVAGRLVAALGLAA